MTITKGRMFRLTIAIDDDRLKQLRKAPELAEAAMQAVAEYWHTKILPGHFELGASAKYGYAPRGSKYLRDRRKGGKPALVLSGSLRRDVLAKASFKVSAGASIELKVTARVLNLVPAIPQNSPDLYVKRKTGIGYPNLKREIKAFTEDEREAMAQIAIRELEKAFGPKEGIT